MFGLFQPVDHQHMALEVRALGPSLFERVMSVKELVESRSVNVARTVSKRFDRLAVLESSDLYRAIKSGVYQGRELAVLRYLHKHKDRIGQIVGTETTVCGHHGETHGYYVIALNDISNYDGRPRYDEARGSVLLAIVGALFFGFGGFATVMALLSSFTSVDVGQHTLVPMLLGGVCALAGSFLGARFCYRLSAQQNADSRALAVLAP